MKNNLKLILAAACLFAVTGNQQVARAATFGWSGSGAGPGFGTSTTWLTAGNWTNNSGTPVAGDIALFGTNGSATAISINFNTATSVQSNVGAIVLLGGSPPSFDRAIGNNSTASDGVLTISGVGSGLLTNAVAGRTLSLIMSKIGRASCRERV